MSTSRLFLSGIRARGRHGVNPEEEEREQEFVGAGDVGGEVGRDGMEITL